MRKGMTQFLSLRWRTREATHHLHHNPSTFRFPVPPPGGVVVLHAIAHAKKKWEEELPSDKQKDKGVHIDLIFSVKPPHLAWLLLGLRGKASGLLAHWRFCRPG